MRHEKRKEAEEVEGSRDAQPAVLWVEVDLELDLEVDLEAAVAVTLH